MIYLTYSKAMISQEQKHRYYLHRMARKHGMKVFAHKKQIDVAKVETKSQSYYIGKLINLGYNVQMVIE